MSSKRQYKFEPADDSNIAHTLYLNKLISGSFKIMHTAVLNYKIRNEQIRVVFLGYRIFLILLVPLSLGVTTHCGFVFTAL